MKKAQERAAGLRFELAAAGEDDTYGKNFRDSLTEKMTPAQLAEARRLVREWKAKGRD